MKPRIGVLVAARGRSDALNAVAKAFADEFADMGFQAALVRTDEVGLSTYDFLVVCSQPAGWGSKLDARLRDSLGGASLIGKRCSAILLKRGIRPAKALSRLMSELEREGLVVTLGEIVSDRRIAAEIARNTPVLRGL